MPSDNPYGVPLPITVLWEAIADRYGDDAVVELQAIHKKATQCYGRASELNYRRRLVKRGLLTAAREREYQASLDDPMAFIDREDPPESPHENP